MTTPTETGYLRYAVIDGKYLIVDAGGRTLGQVVPVDPSDEMLLASGKSDREYTTRNFGADFPTQQQDCWDHYKAMLSAAQVDLTGAVVKVPERHTYDAHTPPIEVGRVVGRNACIDELERK